MEIGIGILLAVISIIVLGSPFLRNERMDDVSEDFENGNISKYRSARK